MDWNQDKPAVLMTEAEVLESFLEIGQRKTEIVRDKLKKENGLTNILEYMQTESDWRYIRAYLHMFDEYADLLTGEEKKTVLGCLFSLLAHRNGAVRRMAAGSAGRLLAKENPAGMDSWKNFLHKMLFPGREFSETRRRWIGFAMKSVFESLMENAGEQERRTVLNVYAGYFKSLRWETLTCLALIYGVIDISYGEWSRPERGLIEGFLRKFLLSGESEIRIACLWLVQNWLNDGWLPREDMEYFLGKLPAKDKQDYCENYLLYKVRNLLNGNTGPGKDAAACYEKTDRQHIIMENQRLENSWLCKLVNLMILKEEMQNTTDLLSAKRYLYACHMLNMLRSSNHAVVRVQAGNDLTDIIPELEIWQRSDIVQELLKAIELREDAASNYIPPVLGKVYPFLSSDEQKKILNRLRGLSESTHTDVVNTVLESAGAILECYPAGAEEDGMKCGCAVQQLTGILCSGMACCKQEIAQEAFSLMADYLFSGKRPESAQKHKYMRLMGHRMLISINRNIFCDDDLYHASSLRKMTRYITEYTSGNRETYSEDKKIAFFTGTFDPFTEGHRAMIQAVVEMGFEVFLNAHAFSWKRKSRPSEIRRQMILMAVADLPHVYLFPEEIPINIGNSDDLKKLRRVFSGQDVYLMVKGVALAQQEAYVGTPFAASVHSFPHIIFEQSGAKAQKSREETEKLLTGEIIYMKLPAYYDSMGDTCVRKEYAGNLYGIEAVSKKTARTKPIDTKRLFLSKLNPEHKLVPELRDTVKLYPERDADQAVLLMDGRKDGKICGGVVFHVLDTMKLYRECGDIHLASFLRESLSGNIICITRIFGTKNSIENSSMTALTEMLASCQAEGYSYAICLENIPNAGLLKANGFVKTVEYPNLQMVDMRRPLAVIYDNYAYIREPFSDDEVLRKTLWDCRLRLQEAIRELYPGDLILNFDSDILNYRLVQLIKRANSVSDIRENEEVCGPKLCVPFGKILKSEVIPNTVTKELCTEKRYNEDLSDFEIHEFPHYAPLGTQVRTLRSFGRPVILVDDLFHKGYRRNKINPILEEEQVEVSDFIVGILSGRGQDMAEENGEKISSAYFIPNMRAWVMASDLYPFIGGESIRTSSPGNLYVEELASVNPVLPYQIPSYFADTTPCALYHLSEICLENAREIYIVLENLYDKKNHRKLTPQRIRDVMAEPRYPVSAVQDMSRTDVSVSELLERELEKLKRLRGIMTLGQ
ncbi:hypothetical protein MCG98_04990 [Ruminococcus sp. OA3]|uniref:hypothetical protein n=1 Tax=Ruminococcus sp. OA3 TaxID=2914164 RepID=UPI001F05C145|nr:hypothetical protein [Ruminococcus sp. OA3]MCH1981925.1 hypothetical protein [Ruminococcus sp. OA3]